ncbi:LOW QUALITY PROTEIN: nose resistant to fluoxetine protein 6-like [Euwallacea similis]|uniref:LOW QUALITY PROTEIN: nose resistant to fluoxetine protein 6-like n=1 Tax=Euwallacea similis TaxID=1736056 RepID=UPI00344E7B65
MTSPNIYLLLVVLSTLGHPCFGQAVLVGSGHFLEDLINQVANSELKDQIREVVSEKCSQQSDWFFENLGNLTDDGMWALRMIDASAKIPAGLLKLNLGGWMGNFEQCLEITSSKRGIKGNYCLGTMYIDIDEVFNSIITVRNIYLKSIINLSLHIAGPLMLRKLKLFSERKSGFQDQYPIAAYPSFGICIPDGCTADDLKSVVELLNLNFSLPFECQTIETANPPLTTKAWCVIAFFAVIVLLMALSTLYDVYCHEEPAHITLTAFSVYTNGKKLLKVQKNQTELSCLNGIRVLSMIWVIAGHSLSITITGPVSNALDVLKYLDATKSMIFVSAVHSVDTFLMVTGLLVVYTYMKYRETGKRFNIFSFYFHRYIRLTPPFFAVILVSMSLLQYLGSGPHWSFIVNYFQGFCEKSWWSSLLYLQNYINVQQWCVGQTWYLNIDWQLYLLSPIFLLALSWRPTIGTSLLGLALAVFMAIPFYVTWTYKLPAIVSNLYGDTMNFQNLYYLKTHTRAAPWFVGALIGYAIAKLRLKKVKITIKAPLAIAIWIMVLTLIPVCIFMGHEDLRSQNYNKYGNAFYNSFVRPVWASCVGWIAFACSCGYGGIINKFLSMPIFEILNKFTYSIYLLHVTMLYMIIYASKTPTYFSFFHVAYSFWGIAMLTLALSVFWVLAFESPIIVIENWLIGRHLRSNQKAAIQESA